MALEIEYKFLVKDTSYKKISCSRSELSQGYLSRVPERTVRIRCVDGKGYITVKGKNRGEVREEYEYEIPYDDAESMLAICEPPLILKTRWEVDYAGCRWEVDEFHGELEGLTLAEVEVSEKGLPASLPEFIGENVTGDCRYYNSALRKGKNS